MRSLPWMLVICFVAAVAVTPLRAQQDASKVAVTLPHLIAFSGTVREADGRPVHGIVGVTFCLYKEQDGGAALWMETQNVETDSGGHYKALLGSTKPDGVPLELFTSGEARWLGVRVNREGEAEQPRVVLVSVPYAVKAADAEMLAGKPASFYLRAYQSREENEAGGEVKPPKLPPPVHGDGTNSIGFLPLWTAKNLIDKSVMFQDSNGNLGVGTSKPAANLDVNGTGNFSGGVSSATVNAGTSFMLGGQLFGVGSISSQNVFLGFSGNLTTSGDSNTATGVSALASNTTGFSNTANGDFALFGNTTGNFNTALGGCALCNNSTGIQNTAVGANTLSFNRTGINETAVGFDVLSGTLTGDSNTAVGVDSLANTTSGAQNTAEGVFALSSNATGSNNTALGFSAGPGLSDLSNSTAIGALAEVTKSNSMVLGSINGVNGATADTNVGIGTTAPGFKLHIGTGNKGFRVEGPAQGTSSPVLASFGGTGDFGIDGVGKVQGRFVVKDSGLVGIATSSPDATLSVNGTADKPGGGSWGTFSDGRLKTLHGNFTDGLRELLQLRPVRYRYKPDNAMGIRDQEEHIGFVAQEVRAVIPEAVSENDRGFLLVNNDPILWTMLNAIKEQQVLIQQQQHQLRVQQAQIKQLARQVQEVRARLNGNGRSEAGVNSVKGTTPLLRQ